MKQKFGKVWKTVRTSECERFQGHDMISCNKGGADVSARKTRLNPLSHNWQDNFYEKSKRIQKMKMTNFSLFRN